MPRGRPNIILVSIDTLRADHLNAYGYKARRVSPNLDALAADGWLFTAHMASAPWTLPSHASLLTSLSPSTHGVAPSLTEFVAPAGSPPALSDGHETLAETLRRAGWSTGAFTGGGPMAPGFGLAQGFDAYDSSLLVKLSPSNQGPVRAWIEAQRQPFFLFLHTFDVHSPYLQTDFLPEVVEASGLPRLTKALAALRARPMTLLGEGEEAAVLEREGQFTAPVSEALYDGSIRHADAWLGSLFDWLKRTGRYGETLIVVTSDHGEAFGERGAGFYNAHGFSVFDELVRVPLLIKPPGRVSAGVRVPAVTRGVDVMPTILALAGLPGPPVMEGHALGPDAASAPALSEAVNQAYEMKSLRDGRYKLIVRIPEDQVRANGRGYLPPRMAGWLYDVESDPLEARDLLRDSGGFVDRVRNFVIRAPEPSETAERLSAELRRRVKPRAGPAGSGSMDEETRERLRSLGYVK